MSQPARKTSTPPTTTWNTAVSKVAINAGALFLCRDGDGKYLSFVQVTEVRGFNALK